MWSWRVLHSNLFKGQAIRSEFAAKNTVAKQRIGATKELRLRLVHLPKVQGSHDEIRRQEKTSNTLETIIQLWLED